MLRPRYFSDRTSFSGLPLRRYVRRAHGRELERRIRNLCINSGIITHPAERERSREFDRRYAVDDRGALKLQVGLVE